MPRVRSVTMDGLTVKISPLTYDEAEEYIKEGRALLDRDPKPSDDEWAKRTLESVCKTLNKAAAVNGNGNGTFVPPNWDIKKLTSEFDMVMIQHIYSEFMIMSGLKKQDVGEAQATSTGN